jgi:hypothetical protein
LDDHGFEKDFQHRLGQRIGADSRVDSGDDDGELVATQSCNHVGPSGPFQATAEFDEKPVTLMVAEGVVDLSEVVEVNHHQRHFVTVVRNRGESFVQTLHHVGSVGQPGKRVVVRLITERGAGQLERGGVFHGDRSGSSRKWEGPQAHVANAVGLYPGGAKLDDFATIGHGAQRANHALVKQL